MQAPGQQLLLGGTEEAPKMSLKMTLRATDIM